MRKESQSNNSSGSKVLQKPPEKDEELRCEACSTKVKAKNAEKDSTQDNSLTGSSQPARPHSPTEHLWSCPECEDLLAIYSEAAEAHTFECPICGEEHTESSDQEFDHTARFCSNHTEEEIQDHIQTDRRKWKGFGRTQCPSCGSKESFQSKSVKKSGSGGPYPMTDVTTLRSCENCGWSKTGDV